MTTTSHSYPAYKPSGVPWLGYVPEHWAVERLSTSVESQINGVWGSDPDGTGDLPCIRVADFDRRNHRIRTDKLTLRSVKPNERSGRILRKGDLLLEKSGGGEQQPVGAVMLYDHHFQAVCSNFVGRMVLRESYDPTYQTYLHATLYAIGVNKRSIKQTTGIQNIDASSYLSELVGVPPLIEQAAIVRYLDHVDRRIRRYVSAKRKLIALLEEEKQAIVNRAVTRGIDPNVRLKPSGVEWLGDVPAHWEVIRLSSVSRPKSVVNQQHRELLSVYLNLGVIRFSDVDERRTNPTSQDLSHYQAVDPGDFVLNNQQAWRGSVGVSNLEGIVSPAYLVLSLSSRLDSNFADLLFRDSSMVGQYVICSKGVGTIQRNLYWPHLKHVFTSVPPLSEQVAIVDYVDKRTSDVKDAIARARRQIELVQEYRTRLIADVVTGKLDVREAAVQLPDEEEPIDEDGLILDNVDDGSYGASRPTEEEPKIESEVTA